MIATLSAADLHLTDDITTLVNRVYETSERGLWTTGTARTHRDEVAAALVTGELSGAFREGDLVGVVRHHFRNDETGEFGMLAADPALRGQGIGRALITHCEQAVSATGRRYMHLELLTPRVGTLDSKEFLAAWYTRLGYRLIETGPLADRYPALAPLLAVPADYRTYRKPLPRPADRP